ncbi:hypothetical protein ACO22_03074 [Paracoccidioides brasiliensis]|uniref:Uncharacterized protein n=1 Tax=Paracoccidioides brasiliensis TaxID=121759 RepID=A0A1D2JGZ8_PARBR|nr:hypothetical protein ACO22_03074 [Paracoccidioides brasiliensis]
MATGTELELELPSHNISDIWPEFLNRHRKHKGNGGSDDNDDERLFQFCWRRQSCGSCLEASKACILNLHPQPLPLPPPRPSGKSHPLPTRPSRALGATLNPAWLQCQHRHVLDWCGFSAEHIGVCVGRVGGGGVYEDGVEGVCVDEEEGKWNGNGGGSRVGMGMDGWV